MIPVLDDAGSLRVCLAALVRQTLVPIEVIVVDNGSTDDTAAVARASGARVVREDRKGIPVAAAAGYDAATGDVIARLDADCIPPADWLASIAAAMTRHPDVSAISGGATFHDGPPAWRRLGAQLYLGAYISALAPALGHVPLFGSNLALRRSAWLDVSGAVHRADPELHDDLDLSFHLGAPRHGTVHTVRFERTITLQISQRPFTSGRALVRRFVRGFRTVFLHWPHELPWLRWSRLLRARVDAHESEPAPIAGRRES